MLDPINPNKTRTNIDLFYDKCNVPIVTTFHTSFNFKQWMDIVVPIKKIGKLGRSAHWGKKLLRYWTHFLNYESFHELNREKLRKSAGSIVFSEYMKNKVRGGTVIYHGAESFVPFSASKKEARSRFSLPQEGRIALAVGFRTATKGWDMFRKMDIPDSWTIVINSSKNHYSMENLNPMVEHSKLINLDMDFLNDTELSLLFHAADAVLLPYKVSSGSGVMFDALAHGLPFIASDLEFFREFSSMGLGITVKRNASAFEKSLLELDANYSAYSKAVESFKNKIKWDYVADMHTQFYEFAMRHTSSRALQQEGPISCEFNQRGLSYFSYTTWVVIWKNISKRGTINTFPKLVRKTASSFFLTRPTPFRDEMITLYCLSLIFSLGINSCASWTQWH